MKVFLVMFMWTLDKFLNPDHASIVYGHFYFIPGLGVQIMHVLGGIELLIITGFLIGIMKTWSYGLVLLFHTISTFSSFEQYLTPFEGAHLLFFAAWPMLGACLALFLLRREDTLMSISNKSETA